MSLPVLQQLTFDSIIRCEPLKDARFKRGRHVDILDIENLASGRLVFDMQRIEVVPLVSRRSRKAEAWRTPKACGCESNATSAT
jgi:hypothetical protein